MIELQKPRLISGPTGPYSHGYLMCRVQYPDGKFRMVTYHKFVYESTYGVLPANFVVHHKNEDKSDNRLENLEALDRQTHVHLHKPTRKYYRVSHPRVYIVCICPVCKQEFGVDEVDFNWIMKRRPDFTGPYCSGTCGRSYALALGRRKGHKKTKRQIKGQTT